MLDRPKRALITGITGMDGSHLAEFLLDKGYDVHGLVRKTSTTNTWRIDHIKDKLMLHYGDMTDITSISKALHESDPNEVYNLAAQGHVKVSFDTPGYTTNSIAIGTLNLLQTVKEFHTDPKVYQAGSSEMFGSSPPPQNESTPFHPRSPYGVAKCAAHWFAVNYREAYDMFVCNGILFNHESPRRDELYVTRKITKAIGRIKAGEHKPLFLGNLAAERDWGYAPDYVEAMWLMLQQDKPDDYVIATGESHSVREWMKAAFSHAGLDWMEWVRQDTSLYRPAEVGSLRGDAAKARDVIGWQPKVRFNELVKIMVNADA